MTCSWLLKKPVGTLAGLMFEILDLIRCAQASLSLDLICPSSPKMKLWRLKHAEQQIQRALEKHRTDLEMRYAGEAVPFLSLATGFMSSSKPRSSSVGRQFCGANHCIAIIEEKRHQAAMAEVQLVMERHLGSRRIRFEGST